MTNNFTDLQSDFDTSSDVRPMKEAYGGSIMRDISGDYAMPDYAGDIEKILLVTAEPRITGTFVSDGKIEIEGDMYYTVLVSSDDGRTSSVVFVEPFDASIDVQSACDGASVAAYTGVVTVNARPTNKHKIGIKSSVEICLKVFCPDEISTSIAGNHDVGDESTLERLDDSVKIMSTVTASERGISSSEDIELDSGMPSIENLILCRVELTVSDVKPSSGTASIRTDAAVSCLYEGDDGSLRLVTKNVPLTHEMNVQGLRDGFECMAFPTAEKIKAGVENNSYGEKRVIELDFTYGLDLLCMCNDDMTVTRDAYSTDYVTEAEHKTKKILHFVKACRANVSLNASVPRSEIGAENVTEITDGIISVNSDKLKFTKSSGRTVAEGTAKISLLTLAGEEKKPTPVSFEYPFKCEVDSSDKIDCDRLVASAFVMSKRFRPDSSNLNVDFEVGIKLLAYEETDVDYIDEISFDAENKLPEDEAYMTLCYPDKSESAWSIAKKYNTSVDDILRANGITEYKKGDKPILIPKRKHKTPMFRKII